MTSCSWQPAVGPGIQCGVAPLARPHLLSGSYERIFSQPSAMLHWFYLPKNLHVSVKGKKRTNAVPEPPRPITIAIACFDGPLPIVNLFFAKNLCPQFSDDWFRRVSGHKMTYYFVHGGTQRQLKSYGDLPRLREGSTISFCSNKEIISASMINQYLYF